MNLIIELKETGRILKRGFSGFLVVLIALLASCQPADENSRSTNTENTSQQLRVVTSGGFTAAYHILAPQFTAQTGIELKTEYGASSGGALDSIPVRLARNENFDIIILSRPSLNLLVEAGYANPDATVDLVRSAIGMAVAAGTEIPDISTPAKFTAVLRDARSIAYSASASGTYLSTTLWPEMGLWPELQAKSRRIESERVAAVVARGDAEIGFQQISEILPIAGIEFVGPIPDELQRITTFSAAILNSTKNIAASEQLLEYLSSLEVAPIIAEQGLMPVVTETH